MSARFTRGDVERLAQLARLALTDDEKTLFARQLAGILDYAEHIQAVDTEGVPPTSHAHFAAPALRDDVAGPSLDRADIMAGAPDADREAGLFKVPRVVGSRGAGAPGGDDA
jgi:aspartyl-tRNA(Asn)/glutamyl-tRNA(Gln) amidotransferase subunit C